MDKRWKVNILGKANENYWEISVIDTLKQFIDHYRKSHGWIDERKLLIGHSGGPCRTKVGAYVFSELCAVAEKLADKLNNGHKIDHENGGILVRNEIELPQNFIGSESPKKDSPKAVVGSTYEKRAQINSKAYIMFNEWQEVSFEEMQNQRAINMFLKKENEELNKRME